MRFVVFASGLTLALAAVASAQTIHGSVSEVGSGHPVPSVVVSLLDSSNAVMAHTVSDEQGGYTLGTERPGTYRVRFAVPGYQAAESGLIALAAGETRRVVAALQRLGPLTLDTVLVEGQRVPRFLEGFYRRKRFGSGTFITADGIEASDTKKFTDLTLRFPGFIVAYDQLGHRTISNAKRKIRQGVCPPLVYVNGAPMGDAASYDMDMLRVGWIAAIEVYNSPAFIPLEFNTVDAVCGVIVVWLKQGRG